MEDISQFSSNIQSPLIQVAKVGPRHNRWQQGITCRASLVLRPGT